MADIRMLALVKPVCKVMNIGEVTVKHNL